MILWINGPYGVGKSTLAEELCRRNPNSFIFDAESVGNAVRDTLPPQLYNGAEFENYPLWFQTCAALLKQIAAGIDGDIYVPMTLVFPDSYEKMAGPLRSAGVEVRHVLLESDCRTVHDRIIARGETEDCWCMRHIEMCLDSQAAFEQVIRVRSVGRSPAELAAAVLSAIKEDAT